MTSNSLTPIINSITALLSTAAGRPILIALDGRCGSGKTTLAAQLAERFPGSRTIHTDDYYLPPAQRVPGWETLPCANMDLKRLRAEVLNPAGRDNRFLISHTPAGREPICRPSPASPRGWSSWRAVTATTRPSPIVMTCGSSSPAPRRSRPAACRPGRGRGIPLLPSAGSRWKRDILQSIPLKKVQT